MTPPARMAGRAVAAAVIVAVPIAAASDSGWHLDRIARLDQRDFYYPDVAIAGNARGRRVAVWIDHRGVHAAVARRGRSFGRSRLVRRETTPIRLPRVAMNSRGDALIVWSYLDRTHIAEPEARDEDCCFGARTAVLRHDGSRGRVKTLTRRGLEVNVEAYAIDGRGRHGIVWSETTYDYAGGRPGVVGRFSRRRGLGAVQKVDADPDDEAVALAYVHGRPRVLIHAFGKRRGRLVERAAHRNGRFGARRVVARGLPRDASVVATANERGDEAVAWTAYPDGKKARGGTRAAGKRLAVRTIARTPSNDLRLAIAPSGAAAVAWSPYRGLRLATSRGHGRPFRRAVTVDRGRERDYITETEVAVDSRGSAAVAWTDAGKLRLALVDAAGRTTRRARFESTAHHLSGQGTGTFDERGLATLAFTKHRYVRVAQLRVDR